MKGWEKPEKLPFIVRPSNFGPFPWGWQCQALLEEGSIEKRCMEFGPAGTYKAARDKGREHVRAVHGVVTEEVRDDRPRSPGHAGRVIRSRLPAWAPRVSSVRPTVRQASKEG